MKSIEYFCLFCMFAKKRRSLEGLDLRRHIMTVAVREGNVFFMLRSDHKIFLSVKMFTASD